MNATPSTGRNRRFALKQNGHRWRLEFSAPAGDAIACLDLSHDLYGWMRADGFVPGRATGLQVKKGNDNEIRCAALVTDKNGWVWDMASCWRTIECAGVEVIMEKRTARFSEKRYPQTGPTKSRDCILASRIRTSIPTGRGEFIMVPSSVYGPGRPGKSDRCQPVYDPSCTSFDFESGRSPAWFLASDRTSFPMVLAMSGAGGIAVGFVPGSIERFPERPGDYATFADGGIGFSGKGKHVEIFITAPYYELPASFAFANFAPSRVRSFVAFPGDIVTRTFLYVPLPPGRHAYAPVLQALYELYGRGFPTRPWMNVAEANRLQAEALHRYHFVPGKKIVRTQVDLSGESRSDAMMIGWASGLSAIAAIMVSGLDNRFPDYVKDAVSVLDRIASEAPVAGGVLADLFDGEKFVPLMDGREINVRVLCEALWIWMCLVEACETHSIAKTGRWREVIHRALKTLQADQADDGKLGFSIDAATGKFAQRRTCSSFMAIGALARGAALFGDDSLLDAAARAGVFYKRFLNDELLYGATLDTGMAVNSEDGYNALIGYMELFEATREKQWLQCAAHACDWFLTFRWAYNQRYPKGTILDRFDFHSIGLDTASVPNQHLHTYGTVCLAEQVKLWHHTGNVYYLQRAADLVKASTQMIARRDNEILNMRRGMHVEQYYNSNWASQGVGKGDIDPRHVAWVPGLCVFGNWCLRREFGGLVVSPRFQHACALDSCELSDVGFEKERAVCTIRNFLDSALELPVTVCHLNGTRLVDRDCRINGRGDACFGLKLDAKAAVRLVLQFK